MILIISDERDDSTLDVLKWLDFFNAKYIIINNKEFIINLYINIGTDDVKIVTKNTSFSFTDINSIWYRRGNFNFYNLTPQIFSKNEKIYESVKEYICRENDSIKEYLYYLLKNKYFINEYYSSKLNKLKALSTAKKCNLNIPETIVTNKISQTYSNKKEIITKSISDPIFLYFDDFWFPMYTTKVEKDKDLKIDYGNSLFQEKIEKKIEIRSFFIEDEFYSMAIFSQKNKKTKIDYRKYDYLNPNRYVPYILPNNIKIKLNNLAKLLNINSGSFDLILTPQNKYVFLEVNPIGQFGMVSKSCNYNLEKLIANKLFENDINE